MTVKPPVLQPAQPPVAEAPVRVESARRTVIESITPQVDGGRFPIKRVVGEKVVVEADAFTDGHDVLSCVVLHRADGTHDWRAVRMQPLGNDRWRASFTLLEQGRHHYTVAAWVDRFLSWQHDFARRVDAEDLHVAALIGAELLNEIAERAAEEDKTALKEWGGRLRTLLEPALLKEEADRPELARIALRYPDWRAASVHAPVLTVVVDRERARHGAWYEMFPRSSSDTPGQHGTFADCEARLPYIAAMGFDVLYLPPIHPVGVTYRKGPNNALHAELSDVGSPWAIGNFAGGHKDIEPELGTIEDLQRLADSANGLGIELALDIAWQCSPDHPYVREHPEWFSWRPDGTVQYAENPPKKYQDIYPLNFEAEEWKALWEELKSVLLYWIDAGVKIFRVDNPHTKPFAFWEWVITEIKRDHPDVLFLAEAFTRPRIMHRLAKLGFTQSYTYFAWRNTKQELEEYFTELCQSPAREYFRPNCWPNTPDILTEYLQHGGRPAFMIRLALAATLSANYGIYGPAYELLEHKAREPGSEEYLDSEKYQLRAWDLERSDSLHEYIARLNRARRDNAALQYDWGLRFFPVDNDQILCYCKSTEDLQNVIVVVVNLDPHHTQSGWVEIDIDALRLDAHTPYQVHDLITDAHYHWHGSRNFVQLDPARAPVHVFAVRRRTRNERDFDYYL